MASSSSAIDNSDYDVFLSFRGTDTRNNFTSHLYDGMCRAQIKAFIDESLRRGEEITPALLKIIEGAKISVIVFSSDYASSTFCLEELVKILECRDCKAQIVLPIFYKVDPGDVEGQKGSYEKSFSKHESEFKGKKRCREEEMSQEDIEKMQRWKSALCRAANLSGWHIDHNSNEVVSIQTIVQDISRLLTWGLTRQSKKGELISKPLDGMYTVTDTLEKLWQCLLNDDTSKVGVYGMGGVGKTNIATHIYNRLRDANSFQHVYWVTVTNESSIYKLQGDIAKKICLKLSRKEDERERAAKLWEALNNRKKFVLILDDMWESFELDEVGIPTSVEGKLLLTTRKHGVCKRIKCEEIVQVKPLPEREARDFFIRECGHQMDDNPELRNIVESVAKECDGLPLAIVTIARSTREFVEIYEWRNILRELQKPSVGQNIEMEEKVFKLLKVSYDHLPNDKYRQCLLYCALYPEDWDIERDEIIKYWIGEGLIDEQECRQAEFDMGYRMIDQLVDASLLERVGFGSDFVMMHDVVRDMALTITRKNFLVKADAQVKNFPKFTDWSVNLERISVLGIEGLERFPFNLAPDCSKLRTLLMQMNDLTELPGCFFDNMHNLTVLDMTFLPDLRVLPESIAKLKNLRWLDLCGDLSLEHIPSLDGLTNLRYLDLSETCLKELPKGMEKLINLKVLHIRAVKKLYGIIPSEVLKELSLLQSLNLGESNIEVEPNGLVSLQNLESLTVGFKNFKALNWYLKSRHWQGLQQYFFYNKEETEYGIDEWILREHCDLLEYSDEEWNKLLFLCKNKDSDSVETDTVFPDDMQFLGLMHWDIPLDGAFRNGNFAHLKKLILSKCKVNHLINVAFAEQLFRNLETLELESTYIEEIIGTKEEYLNLSNHINYPTIQLPNLSRLVLENLPRLRSIYRGKIESPCLYNLVIFDCRKLERLPFSSLPGSIEIGGVGEKIRETIGKICETIDWYSSEHWGSSEDD